MSHCDLMVKLLKKLLTDEVSTRRCKNVLHARPLGEILSSPTAEGVGLESDYRSKTTLNVKVLDLVQFGGLTLTVLPQFVGCTPPPR